MLKTILLAAALYSENSMASESHCLARIMYAESKGEPMEGVIAIGQSAAAKAEREGTTICKLKGVHRESIPEALKAHYKALAYSILKAKNYDVSLKADHWNTGNRPHLSGKITRKIGKHVFYILAKNG